MESERLHNKQQTQQVAQQAMGNTQTRSKQDEKATEEARWLLEGSHGMARDAEAAVALLEAKVKDGDAEAMWMLGVCCEFGMGTSQDVPRAEQLYKRGRAQGNATANLLFFGRMCIQMKLRGEQENKPKASVCVYNRCG